MFNIGYDDIPFLIMLLVGVFVPTVIRIKVRIKSPYKNYILLIAFFIIALATGYTGISTGSDQWTITTRALIIDGLAFYILNYV